MSPPSIAIIHSSSPRRDYEVLIAILPRRFKSQSVDEYGNKKRKPKTRRESKTCTEDSHAISLVASPSAVSTRSRNSFCDTILILATPTFPPNNEHSNMNCSVNTGISTSDDPDFEIVPLTATSSRNASVLNPITSYASLILENQDELRTMAKLALEQEGLAIVERSINVRDDSGRTTSSPMAKFMLPGGCMVTLSIPCSWRNQESRERTIQFMTTTVPKTLQLKSLSGSISSSKSRTMRRTLSMPDMIPKMVMTDATGKKSEKNDGRENGVIIPTLESKVLSFDGNYEYFPLNSETPVPIETELFSGRLLVICRPTDSARVDPYWDERIFSKKRRRLVLQLQGKLKYKPTGTVFAGMEISDPMKLGLIASGLCNLILKLIKGFNPAIHSSFGSMKERAHICFPASTFFETIVVTPPGEEPPKMGGIDFEGEPADMASERKAYKTKIDWNTEDTYSMSFHSMYVDFPTWSVVSLPTGRDISLQTFWGKSLARIVLYEVDKSQSSTDPHLISSIKYIIGVQLKALGGDGIVTAARTGAAALEQQDRGSEDNGDETSEWGSEVCGEESTSTVGDMALMPAFDEDDDNEIDTSLFHDTLQSLPGGDGAVDILSMESSSASSHSTLLSIIDTFCPCWIEMFSKRGKYTTLYSFCGTNGPNRPLFRTVEMAQEIFKGSREEVAEIDDRFSHRVSTNERTRRIFGLKYAEAHKTQNGRNHNKHKLQMFHKMQCRYDVLFLKRRESTTLKVTGDKAGVVARALSDRHWKEERMVLIGESGYLLFHHMDASKVHFRISLSSVINVSPLANEVDLVPFPSYHYLQIETFVRVTILMFHSEEERDSWVEILEEFRRDRSTRLYASELFQYEIPVDDFLSKSSMWDCQKRKILNFRRYSFRTSRSRSPEETLQLAELALSKVLALKPKGANDSDLREFLDCAAALKEADAHSLNEEEKCAFFLNLYHVMIMHSFIILGPPVSGTEWISYFNNVAYQCSDDIFSLTELEHNIIRSKMAYPSNLLSRLVMPKSQYHFALVRPDFRFNFALNSGSLSMPTSVVRVYKADLLNEQLNSVTREFVGYTVNVKERGRNDVQISLPRVCQWFAEDFGPNASASDVLFAIEPYLSEEKRDSLSMIWNSKKNTYEIGLFSLKYLSFNFECRFLTAAEDTT